MKLPSLTFYVLWGLLMQFGWGDIGWNPRSSKNRVKPVVALTWELYANSRTCSQVAHEFWSPLMYAFNMVSRNLLIISVCLSCCGWWEDDKAMQVFRDWVTPFQKLEVHQGSWSTIMLVGKPNHITTFFVNKLPNSWASRLVVVGINWACLVSLSTEMNITLYPSDHGKSIIKSIDTDSYGLVGIGLEIRNPLKSFTVCTGETKSSLVWTHTKPTLNPTNTHTPISISAEGSKEFNSTCVLTVSQRISRALSQWPDTMQSNQQYLKFSLFLLWSFLQESTEYHTILKAKTFINLYTWTHRSMKTTKPAQWAH